MRIVQAPESSPETFRPWVISRGAGRLSSCLYYLRLLIDTPVRSLVSGVKPILAGWNGRVLDVGAGSRLYKNFLPAAAQYRALELKSDAPLFGWEGGTREADYDFYDGLHMPYPDQTFDYALCLEVLEHARDPEAVLRETARVLKTRGLLLFSVPFAAKWHCIPHDYRRFTPSGIRLLLDNIEGLEMTHLYRRGGDFAVAFHMLTVAMAGLFFRKSPFAKVFGLLLSPLAVLCGLAANASELLDLGAPENTIGYIGLVRKKEKEEEKGVTSVAV